MVERIVVREVSTVTSATWPPSRPPLLRSVSVRRSGVSPSSSGEGVDILDAIRQERLAPALPAVGRAEHLRAARDARDVLGVARIERERHHRGTRLHAFVLARPGPAEVGALVERAVLAARGRAETRVERPR